MSLRASPGPGGGTESLRGGTGSAGTRAICGFAEGRLDLRKVSRIVAGPDIDEPSRRDGRATGTATTPLPIAFAHACDQVQGGLALQSEVREKHVLGVPLLCPAAFPDIGGEERQLRLCLREETLEGEPEFEGFGVAQMRKHDPSGPLVRGGSVERRVRSLDDHVGERAWRGGELGTGLI